MPKWLIEEKIPWGALGFVIALIFGGFAVYTTFFYEKRPRVVYEIQSQTRVFDIKEDVPKLDVIFQGESIRSKHETLSLITVKIANIGNSDIGSGAFDTTNLPGLRVKRGKIVKAEFVLGSSDYFSKGERIRSKDDNSFEILPVLLDKGQYFVLKLLLLHAENDVPAIESFGKFGGVVHTEITVAPSTEGHRGLFYRTFAGDFVIQFFRAVVYTVVALALLILAIWLTIAVYKWWRRRRRKRLVTKFRKLLDHPVTSSERAILRAYEEADFEPYDPDQFIIQMNALLNNPVELEKRMREKERVLEEGDYVLQIQSSGRWLGSRQILPLLKEQKVVRLNQKGIAIDQQLAKTIADFESFLIANDPEHMKKLKVPYGSNTDPLKAEDLNKAGPSGPTGPQTNG